MADFLKGARGTVAGDFKNEITVAGSRKKRKKRGGGSGVEQAVSLTLSEILVPRIRLAAAVGVVPKLVDYVTDALQGKLFQNMKKQFII